jgi:CubicO group peptidase (beta-lactamase class C family)
MNPITAPAAFGLMDSRRITWRGIILITGLALLLTSCGHSVSAEEPAAMPPTAMEEKTDMFARFEQRLEDLREELKIPGFSAAVVQDQEMVWAKGFGYADVETQIEATPNTPYHLASLTKPFAAAVIMQLVEEGILGLDDPVSQYGVELGAPGKIRVRHLLSMTSDDEPGSRYRYDGNRFGDLGQVIQAASGESFQALLFQRIVEPLGLTRTVPSPAGCANLEQYRGRCQQVFDQIAEPYALGSDLGTEKGYYHASFGTAAGLVSTVVDLARFDAAMDENLLVSQATKEQMFAPTTSTHGARLPYGLGWFSQDYRGTRLVWHYGHWPPSVSSLIIKAPHENITFIILANTDNLSRPYPLGNGDVMQSSAALAFFRTFIFEPRRGGAAPEIDWEAHEGNTTTVLDQYDDAELQDLLAKEHAAHMSVLASYGLLKEFAERIASMKATDVDTQGYGTYMGRYEVPPELNAPFDYVTIAVDAHKMFVKIPDGPAMELYPQSESSFFFVNDATEILELEFITNETGHATAFEMEFGGQNRRFKRLVN